MHQGLPFLLVAIFLAGCAAVPSVTDADRDAPGTCVEGTREVFSWSFPDGGGIGIGVSDEFGVPVGTRSLDIDWTDPTAWTGGFSVVISDPDGEEIFARGAGDGAGTGQASVSTGGSSNKDAKHTPPMPGGYSFRFESEGTMRGAALAVKTSGCI
jgi:hypothetical protein